MRKILSRIIILMCAIIVLCFASILLNGTVFFFLDSAEKTESDHYLEGLMIGEPELRRIDKTLAWVTNLSVTQRQNLRQLTTEHVILSDGCDISEDFCTLRAATEQSGIYLQYSVVAPAQLPSEMPWHGGFVNPVNGSVYDLFGRAYVYQGSVDTLVVIEHNSLVN